MMMRFFHAGHSMVVLHHVVVNVPVWMGGQDMLCEQSFTSVWQGISYYYACWHWLVLQVSQNIETFLDSDLGIKSRMNHAYIVQLTTEPNIKLRAMLKVLFYMN